MRFSNTLIPTLRDDPARTDVASQRLLLRAGFLRQLNAGIFTWLPLGFRVLQKVEAIVREEMQRINAQEILMPFVQPAELWQESGRWEQMGAELLRIQDRHERDFCLSPTHEEIVTDLFRNNVRSYRELPCTYFHMHTKFRDEIRPRFGLMRAREFIMKDAYSFHLEESTLDKTYWDMYEAYSRILDRIGLDYRSVEADNGLIGGSSSHEFQVLAEAGEDVLAFSDSSDYAANIERAEARPPATRPEAQESMEKVHTPNAKTIESVADLLGLDATRCVKTLIVQGQESLVALILRGDHDLNELKAEKLPGIRTPFQFADPNDIENSLNCSIGSIGPVGLEIPYYVDRDAAALADFVCGANEDNYHYTGANWERDAHLQDIVDIRNVVEGDLEPNGTGRLLLKRGIEVGHIFKLGRKYSESMRVAIQDQEGAPIAPAMGCYGFGVTRTVAAVIEQCHDEAGILWPESIAPAKVHLISVGADRSPEVGEAADKLYQLLQELNVEVLYDDRAERPGVKFADADLIGIPHRVVIGSRTLKEGVLEYRFQRNETEKISESELKNRVSVSSVH
ncbi:MAG: proline--tRNA ligase [Gammaproteobacteria bacterium]|nr:proline--tRNA ligase [Gammaproteobacteria bacterium]